MKGARATDYEEMEPSFAWHRAIIKNVLHDCHKLSGLTLEEIGQKVENYIKNYRRLHNLPKSGRDRPTIANRMREIKKEEPCVVVCLTDRDRLNHHWHIEKWKQIPRHRLIRYFPALQTGVLKKGEVLPKLCEEAVVK